MTPGTFSIGAPALEELSELLALLEECKLPREGVTDHLGGFLVARNEGALLGVVGLECYGSVGLLRSLAVSPKARSQGLGGRLVESILDAARQKGVRELYLLTETAEGFFPRFGFEEVPRASVDGRLEASAELQGACPETAIAMRKAL